MMRRKEEHTVVAMSGLCGVLGSIAVLMLLGSASAQPAGAVLSGPPPRAPLPLAVLSGAVGAPRLAASIVGLSVDTSDRAAVVTFFNSVYLASERVAIAWTGSVQGCVPGQISQAYRDVTLSRVNYFRAMAGLPANVTLDDTLDQQSQSATLMMSAAGALSHAPSAAWPCYSVAGADAAGKSNLALGVSGPTAVSLYIKDGGGITRGATSVAVRTQ